MGSDLDILTIYFTDVKRRGMARPLRLQFPGATYHVISRGNNREPIFLKDSDRLKFLELLGRLVGKSLVERSGGEGQYRLLETVRQYAQEKLREAGEEAAVCQRHRDWYLQLAEQAEPALRGPEQVA